MPLTSLSTVGLRRPGRRVPLRSLLKFVRSKPPYFAMSLFPAPMISRSSFSLSVNISSPFSGMPGVTAKMSMTNRFVTIISDKEKI